MRPGISTTLVVGIVIVVVLVAGVGAYLVLGTGSKNSSTTTQPSTTSTSSSQSTSTSVTSSSSATSVGPITAALNASFNQFIADFNAQSVAALGNFYTTTSVANWTGVTGGTAGVYRGPDDIVLVFATTVGHTNSLHGAVANLTQFATGSDTARITYNLKISGISKVVGAFNSTVYITADWVNQNSQWTIQKEHWNYLSFQAQNPSSVTVFPQWGLALNGHPPNLADEHVIEWNVAPYLALFVYGSIVALGIALVLVRKREQKN